MLLTVHEVEMELVKSHKFNEFHRALEFKETLDII